MTCFTHARRTWPVLFLIAALLIAPFLSPDLSPVQAQDNGLVVESDDAAVAREGSWSSQAAAAASGGSYLYNTGSGDALSLVFSGSNLEVRYVSGPGLGTLAVEVDGSVLRTVITTDTEIRYGQSTSINYLTDDTHTLRVYAQEGGVVGVDAFVVSVIGEADVVIPAARPPIDVSALHKVAQTKGSVAVIVGFNASFTPEGQLGSAQAVSSQRAGIAQTRQSVTSALAGTNAVINQNSLNWLIPYFAANVDAIALNVLASNGLVTSITEDIAVPPTLDISTQVIDADLAWALGWEGTGHTVAILDTGVETGHTFFGGRVVAQACFSNSTGTQVTLCPNGLQTQTGVGAAEPTVCAGLTGCFHGTHVAGIAAGNGATFDGVARDATIIAVQVFSRFNAAGDCAPNPAPCILTFTSDWVSGLNHVFTLVGTHDISSANMSLGGGSFTTTCDGTFPPATTAINQLLGADVATVISSGNSGSNTSVGFPGCISSAVTVGATNDADAVTAFSNSDDTVDLLAPGQSINSSVTGGGFNPATGTSMAAPHVTGAFALLREADPTATVLDILTALAATGAPITDPDNGLTRPRIDLDDAANALTSPPPVPNAPTGAVLSAPTLTGLTLDWTDNSADESGFRIYRWNGTAYVLHTSVAANDVSEVLTGLTCGTTYQIGVLAYNAGGESAMSVDTEDTSACPPPPANDLVANAIGFTALPYTNTQNVQYSTITGDPALTCTPAIVISNSVWYRFTPTTSGIVTADTVGTTADTVLAVYHGPTNGLISLGCNDDTVGTTSEVQWQALAGTPYYILLAVFGGTPVIAPTNLTLNVAADSSLTAASDTLSVFNPTTNAVRLFYNLANTPPAGAQFNYTTTPSFTGGQWVMGDWNGDGQETPGVYLGGAFRYTNSLSPNGPFTAIWVGPTGTAVAGRFSAGGPNDCIGVVEQGFLAPYVVFVMWYTCDLTSGPTPAIPYHWVSAVLSDQAGFAGLGTHQFTAGDWNNDGLDTVAARRGPFVAYTNTAVTTIPSSFSFAQYFGDPSPTADYGAFVAGDWDNNNVDSFGLFYPDGIFYRRNDLDWNSGVYVSQTTAITGANLQPVGYHLD